MTHSPVGFTNKCLINLSFNLIHLLMRLLMSFTKIVYLWFNIQSAHIWWSQCSCFFTCQVFLSVLWFPSNLFFMKASKDFSDGHLWYSVISRPPSSTFTRVQRVSCCFSLLLCTMLTSIMFYGIPSDPSEQTMDLGTAFIRFILSLKTKRNSIVMTFWLLSTFSWQKSTVYFSFSWDLLDDYNQTAVDFRRWTKQYANICSFIRFCFSVFLQAILSLPGSNSWLEFRVHSSCFPLIFSLLAYSDTHAPERLVVAKAKEQHQTCLGVCASHRVTPRPKMRASLYKVSWR